jgi:chemotaxis protein methyltransferase CheR
VLPRLHLRWAGFRRVRGQVLKRMRKRMTGLGLDVAGYRELLERDASELARLDDFSRITISRFYRDRSIFDLLRRELPRGRPLRAVSLGCASGEEPWTLALIAVFDGLALDITAVDADPRLLERARRGVYDPGTLRELPPGWRERAFTPEGEAFRLRDELRARVTFLEGDLRRSLPEGPFDLVLCRNVAFTYFDEPLQHETAARLAGLLREGGLLVLGAHERLPAGVTGFEPLDARGNLLRRL